MLAIIGALTEEIENLTALMARPAQETVGSLDFFRGKIYGVDTVVCRCGVGKVNAAVAVSLILERYPETDTVVNIGVAGGLGEGMRQGDIAIAEGCVQHDFDQTPDGLKKGQIQGFDSPIFPCDLRLADAFTRIIAEKGYPYRRGIIASGDQFICDKRRAAAIRGEFSAVACDMESAAMAQVCSILNRRFISLRAISDNGDDSALGDFYGFVTAAAARGAEVLSEYIRRLAVGAN